MDKYQACVSALRTCAVHSTEEKSKVIMAEAANIINELLATAELDPELPLDRAGILHRAEHMVCGHREQDYGSPEDSFTIIAALWSAYLGRVIDPKDVAMLMALLKIARIRSGKGTADSFIDLAGYAACGGEIAVKNN